MAEGKRRPAPDFLRLRRVRDARLVARPVLDDWSGGAGVVENTDEGQAVVRGTGIRRMGREQIPAPALPVGDPLAEHDVAVFAGYLYDHYGHFLLESTARLWLPSLGDDVPVIWIANWTEQLSPWMHEILDIMGVGPRREVVTSRGPVAVRELAVADAGFEFGAFMHPWHARCLQSAECTTDGSHVWLSRAGLRPISGLDDDLELEDRLRADGWSVIAPETMSVREQVEVLGRAVHVAGLEGSALHTLALLRGFSGVVDLFTRQEHVNFELVAEACRLDQVRHSLPGAVPRERQKERGVDVQWSGLDLEATLGLLRRSCTRHA
ncbi:MAG: hypothetical protein RJB65_314 [Actinomycetota bacterium]